jgi:hypothetical protein
MPVLPSKGVPEGGEMSKKIPNWVLLKYDIQPPVFMCERCGAKREAHLPAAIDDFVKQGKAFAESHKYCKESQ